MRLTLYCCCTATVLLLQHLREKFHALAPIFKTLCSAYPAFIKPELFEWGAYIWAAELWYSYAIQVRVWHLLV